MNCEECIMYDDSDTYPNTGFCELVGDYVKAEESACQDFEYKEESK